MPLKLINTVNSPPGGHFFYIEPTKKRFGGAGQYPDRSSLRSAMRPHCVSHHIPIPTDPEIDEYMCKSMPPGWCADAATGFEVWNPVYRGGCDLSFRQVIQGTRTLGYWATHGRPRVEGALAEQRAAVCVECPQNRTIEGCSGCSLRTLTDAIGSVVQGQSTTKDELLNGCCICGCALKALVWLPLDVLLKYKGEPELNALREKAPHCWQLQEQLAKAA